MRGHGYMLIILLACVEALTAVAIVFAVRGDMQIMTCVLCAQVMLAGVAFYYFMGVGASAAEAHFDVLSRAHGDPFACVSPEGVIHRSDERAAAAGFRQGGRIEDIPGNWLKPLIEEALRRREPVAPPPPASFAGGLPSEFLLEVGVGEERRFFHPRAWPVINPKGEVANVWLVLRDRTELKRLVEDRSRVLSGISHDLRTPMTSIQMSIHLLLEDAASRLTPRQLELLEAARDDAERLHRMMEEMLSRARGAGTVASGAAE